MNPEKPAERYWHCSVQAPDSKKPWIVNDLSYSELQTQIVDPWRAGRPFTVSGKIVRSPADISEIKIVWTERPMQHYANEHNAAMEARRIADFATNRRAVVFKKGEDVTFSLLFSEGVPSRSEPDSAFVERICTRIRQVAQILGTRSRIGKTPYPVEDEYDVQDLLHAVLRGYLKYSVQEDPLPKVAGTKSGRADISIEELGLIIEIKFVRHPDDHKSIFKDYSQDLVLYSKWPHLKQLIFLIYNASELRDAESFDKLSGPHEVGGRRFTVSVVRA